MWLSCQSVSRWGSAKKSPLWTSIHNCSLSRAHVNHGIGDPPPPPPTCASLLNIVMMIFISIFGIFHSLAKQTHIPTTRSLFFLFFFKADYIRPSLVPSIFPSLSVCLHFFFFFSLFLSLLVLEKLMWIRIDWRQDRRCAIILSMEKKKPLQSE